MEYTPNKDPRFIGTWTLDGAESVADLKAAILAERQRIADAQGTPLPTRWGTFPRIEVRRPPRAFRTPRPGDGTLSHDQRTAAAIELCARHGAEFWAHSPTPRSVWGVKDGKYVAVYEHGCTEVGPRGW